jgi:hypothetical protein
MLMLSKEEVAEGPSHLGPEEEVMGPEVVLQRQEEAEEAIRRRSYGHFFYQKGGRSVESYRP